jgi:hypothetical protein
MPPAATQVPGQLVDLSCFGSVFVQLGWKKQFVPESLDDDVDGK